MISCLNQKLKNIEVSGVIEIIEIEVAAKSNEIIKELYYKEGDTVNEGTILAEINHELLDLQLLQAKATLDLAKKDFDRTIDLYNSGNVSLKEKEIAENKYVVAKTTFEILKKQIDDCYIKSPITGMITNKFVEKGEFVTVGTPIYTVTRLDPVTVTIYITEKELALIKPQQIAKIKIDGLDKSFLGKIIYISPKAEFTPKNIQTKEERVKQIFAVKIEVENKDGILKPGMSADVIIESL